MSAYSPENYIEGLYIGAAVWWRQRHDDGLIGAGRIHGFIWDTDTNGVLIEFEQHPFIVRYFVTFEDLKDCWQPGSGGIFNITQAKFIMLVPSRLFLMLNKVISLGSFVMNQQRVPVWTSYR